MWWGDELATQIKVLGALVKDIRKRLEKTKDAQELNLLTVAVKRASSVQVVMESLGPSRSMDTEAFREAFDLQCTSLKLAPLAEVVWPDHILWGRQRHSIRACADDADKWVKEMSCASLKQCGRQNPQRDQQDFISEFLGTALKLPTLTQAKEKLATVA